MFSKNTSNTIFSLSFPFVCVFLASAFVCSCVVCSGSRVGGSRCAVAPVVRVYADQMSSCKDRAQQLPDGGEQSQRYPARGGSGGEEEQT